MNKKLLLKHHSNVRSLKYVNNVTYSQSYVTVQGIIGTTFVE
jgi:hypothetical protein